jgi:hypothetical protein
MFSFFAFMALAFSTTSHAEVIKLFHCVPVNYTAQDSSANYQMEFRFGLSPWASYLSPLTDKKCVGPDCIIKIVTLQDGCYNEQTHHIDASTRCGSGYCHVFSLDDLGNGIWAGTYERYYDLDRGWSETQTVRCTLSDSSRD